MSQRGEWRRREELFKRAFELTAEASTDTLLRKVLDLALELGGADHGSLVLLGPDGDVHDLVTSGVEQERRKLDRSSIDAGVVGKIITEAETLRLTDVAEDPSLVGFPRRNGAPSPFLGLPITLWGRVFGALCLGRCHGAPEFDDADEREMALLGAQVGVALDHARLLQEARVRERALVAVKEVSQAILEGLSTDEVLRLVARSARELAGASTAIVNTPDPSQGSMMLRVAAGSQAEALEGMTFSVEESFAGDVMRTGAPLLIDDVGMDGRMNQPVVRIGGMGPALFVPLAVGDHTFGTLVVARKAGGRCFRDDDVLLLQTFAAEAAVALHYGQIRIELERLSLLEERERIAMDLHDGVIQALFVVGLSLQAAQEVTDDPEEVGIRLADAVGSIDQTIRDLRDYIFGLQPGELEDHRLERALREVAGVFQRSVGVSTLVEVEPEAASLLADRASDVTHIAREAISNAVRHSGAECVTLTLRSAEDSVLLEVSDDGAGFDPEQADGQGNGLVNLRNRARALGGVLTIDSKPGAGCTVRLRVPA